MMDWDQKPWLKEEQEARDWTWKDAIEPGFVILFIVILFVAMWGYGATG